MSIVLISPQRKQKVFFMVIAVLFLVFVGFVYLQVFPFKVKQVAVTSQVLVSRGIVVDMSIFDSAQFKSLQPFVELGAQQTQTGRDNPFVPYQALTPATKATK